MSIAFEADNLLRELREMRDRHRRDCENDLAAIDREYECALERLRRARLKRTALLALAATASAAALAWIVNLS